jgi:WD40 repeat protein
LTGIIKKPIISPDGKMIVSGSDDNTLKLWDTETGKEIATLAGHIGEVNTCAFSPDGSVIACGDELGNFYLYKLKGFDIGSPIITACKLWLFCIYNNQGSYDDKLTTDCPYCGTRFTVYANIIDTICSINLYCHIVPDDSPCLKLPGESWDEPRLLSECPKCGGKLKFNPFVVDNKGRWDLE